MTKIGVISDTHGLLRKEVIKHLQGCDAILHAGDINKPEILEELRQIAPLYVVRGNNDKGEWAEELPICLKFEIAHQHFFMAHQKKDVPKNLEQVDWVITGHSHKYLETHEGKVTWLNPGSCGKRRFGLEISMAIIEIENGQIVIHKLLLNPDEK